MENVKDVIEKQKLIADAVLNKLEIIDPYCILAGGAPRNWEFGRPARDLDIYLHIPEHMKEFNIKRFSKLTIDVVEMSRSERTINYNTMLSVVNVYKGIYQGIELNLVVTKKPTFECVINEFALSINKIWYKNNLTNYNISFIISVISKKLFKNNKYSIKEAHIEKIMGYFPNYEIVNYDERAIYDLMVEYSKKFNLFPCSEHRFIEYYNENKQNFIN
jgi:hypothetical protein